MRIGIDIGGTTVSCAIVEDGNIISKTIIDTKSNRPYSDVIHDIAMATLDTLKNAKCDLNDIEAIGVGCPGILDRETGVVIYSNNISWENVPLVETFKKYIPKQVYVDNDANCAALGEYICGAARGMSSSVTITLGTGVGSGIILNDRIHNGFNSAANAAGHMVIVSGGEPCSCGRNGCWESYASVTALIRMSEQMAGQRPDSLLAEAKKRDGQFNGKNIFSAAKAGDPTAISLLDRYFFYVAEGIINMINIFQPEVFVIGGGISHEGNYFLNPVKKHVANGVYCKKVPIPEIRIATLNNNAGIIGASYLKEYQTRGCK